MSVRQEKNKNKIPKDGRSWYYDIYYTDIYGNRKEKKSKYYATKKEAQNSEVEFINGIKKNISFDTNISGIELLKEWLVFKENKVKSPTFYSVDNVVKNHIEYFFKQFKSIHLIKVEHLLKFREDINSKTFSTDHKNRIILYVQEILDYAVVNYDFDMKVASKLQKIKDEHKAKKANDAEWNFWTPDEWKKFIKVVDDDLYYLMFNFLYFTGLRFGEMVGLTWEYVDLSKSQIKIIQALSTRVKGKLFELLDPKTTNSIRVVDLPDNLVKLLKEHYEKEKKIFGFNNDFFVFGNVRFIPRTTFAREMDSYILKANVKRITPHGFRHSHVSLLIHLGCDSRDVANRIGDTVKVVEETYYHMFPEKKKKTIELLNQIE